MSVSITLTGTQNLPYYRLPNNDGSYELDVGNRTINGALQVKGHYQLGKELNTGRMVTTNSATATINFAEFNLVNATGAGDVTYTTSTAVLMAAAMRARCGHINTGNWWRVYITNSTTMGTAYKVVIAAGTNVTIVGGKTDTALGSFPDDQGGMIIIKCTAGEDQVAIGSETFDVYLVC